MKVVYFGGGAVGADVLTRVVSAGAEVRRVVAPPPAPAGRGGKVTPAPVEAAARRLGLAVAYAPGEEAVPAALRDADVAVVCDYGALLRAPTLAAARWTVNVHPSLLPRWRGAAPIERALLAGDAESGVSIMEVTARLDAGAVLAQWRTPLSLGEDVGVLRRRFAAEGAALLWQVLVNRGAFPPRAQDEALATYAPKVGGEERRLDFSESAVACLRRVLAFAPTAFFVAGGERVRVVEAELASSSVVGEGRRRVGEWWGEGDEVVVVCGEGALRVRRLQRAGRGVVSGAAFLRGWRGASLSSVEFDKVRLGGGRGHLPLSR